MSLDVPVSWMGDARSKWDTLWVARMLSGDEGRPAGGYRFVDTPWTPEDGLGRVLVAPVGDYTTDNHAAVLLDNLNSLPWCLLIATSDERSLFPWRLMDPWPEHCRAWVMTPRPGVSYPPGARFIGEGSPTPVDTHPALTRDLDLFFSGQIGSNERRKLAAPAMQAASERVSRSKIKFTPRFLHSMFDEPIAKPGGDDAYRLNLSRSWIAPCPSGTATQDSFRLYEALEAGCIPIADELSPVGNPGYWHMIGMGAVMPTIEFWDDLPVMAESLLADRCEVAAHIGSRWQQYKRNVVHQLHDDVYDLLGLRKHEPPHDAITVLVVTSPVPSNPDLSMIQDVIASVRSSLPEAEILIGCDAPHPQDAHRAGDYGVFLHRLCVWANTQFNVTVFTAQEHSHESGLLRMLMPEVRTSHVLFVEHDCPLLRPVDFGACLDEMVAHNLRHLRFSHERHVLDEHDYLYPFGLTPLEGTRHIRTVQYSSRPAIYTTDLMNELLDTYFAEGATCMIESVLYGAFQHAEGDWSAEEPRGWRFAAGLRHREAWKRYRSALWAPEPNLAFSGHVDGRGGEPNVPIFVKYPDGIVPPGSPPEGKMLI